MENHVLGIDSGQELSADLDAAHLQFAQRHSLRREHVADLRRADAERNRPERPVRARMRVTARDRRARLRNALLGPDDVHDALLAACAVEKRDARRGAILAQLFHHGLRERIAVGLSKLISRHDVVDCGKGPVRHRDLEPQIAEHPKGLRARHLVDEVGAH